MRLLSRTTLALVVLATGLTAVPAATAAPAAGPAAGPAAVRPAEGSYDKRHLLVTFAPGTPGAERAAAHAGERARVVNRFDWMATDVVELREGQDAADIAPRYERNPNVVDTSLNWVVDNRANDTLYKDQWGLHNTGQPVTGSSVRGVADNDIDAPEGWAAAFGASNLPATGGARVGILDTGIDRSHVELLNKTKACATANTAIGLIVEGTCSDDNLHGTHVAGTVGAATGNGLGVAGVAPNAEFAIFKGLDAAGTGFYADIIAGVHWLHTTGGAKIISMSIGGPQDDAFDRELSEAYAAGTLLIAAAGNDGDATRSWPAHHPDVVSVAATNAAGNLARFSTCNSDVEIAAPGQDIWSTFPGNTYGVISGTSMATPHVSGVAAMLSFKDPTLTNAQLRSLLKSSAQGSSGCNNTGVVNLPAALAAAGGGGSGGTSPAPAPAPTGTGTIAGAVTDARSKKGLSGATVNCGTAGTATTGTNGGYSLASVPVGSYSCTASAAGHKPKTTSVTVAKDTTTTVNFALR